MLDKKRDRTKELFDWYLENFKIIKDTYLTNRYLKDWIGISSETLQMKKKPKELIETKKILNIRFKRLIQEARKSGKIENIGKSRYILIK